IQEEQIFISIRGATSMLHHRQSQLAACLLVLAAFLCFGVFAPAGEEKKEDKKKPAPLLSKKDQLTEDDEKDTHKRLMNSPRKVYKIKLTEGKIYQIDLKSDDFDSVLRLEDAGGKELALNDDFMPGSLDSRILYAASKTAEYKIIATCL